jgi:large subunit ribosomal protein L13
MMGAKTFSPKPRDIERRWYVIDADGAVLGRLATEVAQILRGKHKPIFAPHMDTGDHVIVINAKGVRLTGGKEEKKVYHRHSGYPGGIRELRFSTLVRERPAVVIESAVRGMLPKNRLGRAMLNKLAVYDGPEHPHQAQKPEPLALGAVPPWDGLPAPKPAKPKAKPEPKAAAKKAATAKPRAARATSARTPAPAARPTRERAIRSRAKSAAKATDEAPAPRRRSKKTTVEGEES